MGSTGKKEVKAFIAKSDNFTFTFVDNGKDRVITQIPGYVRTIPGLYGEEANTGELSFEEVLKRMKKSGAEITTFSPTEYEEYLKKYREERNNRPDYELGVGMKDNREHRRQARRNRLSDRAVKRGSR